MNRWLTFLIFAIVNCAPVAAHAGPELTCFSDRSVDDLFADWKIQTGQRLFLVIVGEGPFEKSAFEQDDWDRSIWNDPAFAAYLSEHEIQAVYMSGKENAAFYSTLEISSFPRVLLYRGSVLRSSRAGLGTASDELRTSMIEWIEQVQSGTTPVEAAYMTMDADPDNARLRMDLMEELCKERRETEYLEQLCWLIKNHEQHKQVLEERSTDLTERAFRYDLLYRIMSLRDNQGLSSDGWADAIAQLEYTQRNPWRSVNPRLIKQQEQHKLLIDLRRTFEARIANSSANDRDQLILRALTAEGDEQRSLIKQYSQSAP